MNWRCIPLRGQQVILFVCFVIVSSLVGLATAPNTFAAQTIPYKMNFQGRLTDSSGTPKADGTYNMRFRIYDASSGGTLVWSEERSVFGSSGVDLVDGLFSTQLGDVTALDPADFTDPDLYFEIELPTPATATCATNGCASYTEGAMTPRHKLGSSAYALNADTIDGIDGADLAQLGTTNTFTAANTFNSTLTLGSTNSTTKLLVRDNSSTALLTADTSTFIVKVGTTASATLANVRLLSTDAEFTGTVRIGTATNGVDISGANGIVLSGTARPTRTITLAPEYPGAVLTGDGSSNTGTMTSDFCSSSSLLNINTTACNNSTDEHNYYAWTTTQGSVQDYDIYVRYRMPADYDTGSMANMRIWGWGTTSANEVVSLALYKGSGTACSTITNAITGNTTWNEANTASPLGACSIAAGDLVTFKVGVAANTNNTARAGEIRFEYRSKF